jgi:5-methylcytosine-specific restriction endonuclease McrA
MTLIQIYPRDVKEILWDMRCLRRKRYYGAISRREFLQTWGMLRDELSRTDAYRRFRSTVLERDGRRCKSCGKAASVVHHRLAAAKHINLVLDPANGESMCAECHNRIHGRLNAAEEG